MVDSFALPAPRTKLLASIVQAVAPSKTAAPHNAVAVIDGGAVDANVKRAVMNMPRVKILPALGANVRDVVQADVLVMTTAGIEALAKRHASASSTA